MTVVRLPWPTGPLWPNRRPHWSVKGKHIAKAHHAAWVLCMEANVPLGPSRLTVTMHPPRKPGRMNVDNCIAALKPYLDGIARAMDVDDSELRISWPEAFSEPVKGGAVVVEFTA